MRNLKGFVTLRVDVELTGSRKAFEIRLGILVDILQGKLDLVPYCSSTRSYLLLGLRPATTMSAQGHSLRRHS